MRKICIAVVAIGGLAMGIAGIARADETLPRERVTDRREVRQDHRQTADDRFDRARVTEVRDRYGAARAVGDTEAIALIDVQVRAMLAGERAESRAEVAGDQAELRRSRRETRRTRDAALDGDAPASELRDDRRDRRDDRRDVNVERREAAVERDLSAEWAALAGHYDETSLAKRADLLDTLVATSSAEVRRDHRETREDRRERREDRP